jgi:hypothetical protein
MLIVHFESGRKAEFEEAQSWAVRGCDNTMYVHILDMRGETIESFPLDDVAEITEE